MSARATIGPICKALNAPIRASPIAGPSRLPLIPSRRTLQTETANTSTKLPLDKTYTTKLAVRTSQPLTSILQAYAVLRSIESTYGQVMTFDVNRDPDSQLPTNLLFFTLAESVNLHGRDTLHEIPSPQSSLGPLERYGGPSLDDIRSVLRDDYRRMPKSKAQNQNQNNQSSITFRVELRRTSGYNQPLPVKKTTPTTIQQDKRIAEALEKFGDGFFGAFKGLGEKHSAIVNSKGRMRTFSDNKSERRDRKGSSVVQQSEEGVEVAAEEVIQAAEDKIMEESVVEKQA
jgi:hypothetical protein